MSCSLLSLSQTMQLAWVITKEREEDSCWLKSVLRCKNEVVVRSVVLPTDSPSSGKVVKVINGSHNRERKNRRSWVTSHPILLPSFFKTFLLLESWQSPSIERSFHSNSFHFRSIICLNHQFDSFRHFLNSSRDIGKESAFRDRNLLYTFLSLIIVLFRREKHVTPSHKRCVSFDFLSWKGKYAGERWGESR